jgi:hypothetical protein
MLGGVGATFSVEKSDGFQVFIFYNKFYFGLLLFIF